MQVDVTYEVANSADVHRKKEKKETRLLSQTTWQTHQQKPNNMVSLKHHRVDSS